MTQHLAELPAEVVGVLHAGVHALPAGRRMHVRGVARQEHPPFTEALGHRRARPEVRCPQDLGDLVGGQMGAGGDQGTYARGRDVRLAVGDLAHQLEVVRARQRAEGEIAGAVAGEDVPVEPVKGGDADIGDQYRRRVDVLAGHRDAQRAAHRAAAAVGRDRVGGAHRPGRQLRAHAVLVLGDPRQGGAEGDAAAELGQPGVQDLLGPPLREQPGLAVRRGIRGPGALEHVVLALPGAVLPDHPDRGRPARREDRVHHAQVVEDLHGAGLDALASGAGEEGVRLLDDEGAHAAAGQIAGEGEPGGSGPHDQYVSFLNAVKFHGWEDALNAVKLSRWLLNDSTGPGWRGPPFACSTKWAWKG